MGRILRRSVAHPRIYVDALNSTRRTVNMCALGAFGTTTLVAGTKTVTVAIANALSVVRLTKTAHVGAPGGVEYKIVPSAGQFIVTAIDASGATVAADLSTFNYKVETPTFHADQTPQTDGAAGNVNLSVTAADATSLATSITLSNQIRQILIMMVADAGAHLVADATNVVSAAVATDLATVQTLLNDCKTKLNAHFILAGVHFINDTINTVATANATDQSSANALAISLKGAINAHLASAPGGDSITLINA